MVRRSFSLALLLCLVGGCASFEGEREARYPTPARGMVVCEHPLAAGVGAKILEAGGNAADAAVATAFALAVVLPRAGNLGGGGFAIWVDHDPTQDPLALDFRETAPATLTSSHFLDANGEPDFQRSIRTSLGVGTPGSVAGLWELHERLGSMTFAEVLGPAIELAEQGFEVDPWLAQSLEREATQQLLSRTGVASEVFYPNGRALRAGELLVQPMLAETLQRIRRQGPDGFYRGEVAEAIVEAVQVDGGVLQLQDLLDYKPKWREPLRGWFRGLEVVTVPPPSSGGVVLLQVLGMLDGFPLDAEIALANEEALAMGRSVDAANQGLSARAVHWWIETMRRGFSDRAEHLGDPDFHEVPTQRLLSADWIAERRISVGEFATPEIGPLGIAQAGESDQTTHISVLDSDGNAVSLTTTLNASFGCGLLVPGVGVMLNNELDDFAIHSGLPNLYGLVGGSANSLQPGKRPLSSMTPTVVREDGRVVRWVLGAPGGPRIITAVIQVLLRGEVYGLSVADAVAAPRLHQQWVPSFTRVEAGWDPVLLQGLNDRRHEIVETQATMGRVQAIRVFPGGEPEGASDPRDNGAVAAEGLPVQPASFD